jgi:hypothetical protein
MATPEEIRSIALPKQDFQSTSEREMANAGWYQATFLQEIAAQLAELNEWVRKIDIQR